MNHSEKQASLADVPDLLLEVEKRWKRRNLMVSIIRQSVTICVSGTSVFSAKTCFSSEGGKKREPPLHYPHCPDPDNEVLPCNYFLFLKPSVSALGELTG